MNEIIFVVEDSPEGGYIAKGAGESIFTEADIPWLKRLCRTRWMADMNARGALGVTSRRR